MDAPNQIKKAFLQLMEEEEFVSNVPFYTKAALQAIYNSLDQRSEDVQCPTPFLMMIVYYIANSQALQHLASQMPQTCRDQYLAALKALQKKQVFDGGPLKLINDCKGSLVDVKWQMYIQNGRQIWNVQLYESNSEQPIQMKLNYQQMSLLSFRVNQLVSHIKSIETNDLI